jgi:hypothetical protein
VRILPLSALALLLVAPLAGCRKKPAPGVTDRLSAPPSVSTAPLTEQNSGAGVKTVNPSSPAGNLPGLTTSCSIVSATSVEGYAQNGSSDDYLVAGIVEFSFGDPSLPHPNLQTPANARIPNHGSALVARLRLAFTAKPGSPCALLLGSAVRKL